jgi:propanediol dehydratase small subunit
MNPAVMDNVCNNSNAHQVLVVTAEIIKAQVLFARANQKQNIVVSGEMAAELMLVKALG